MTTQPRDDGHPLERFEAFIDEPIDERDLLKRIASGVHEMLHPTAGISVLRWDASCGRFVDSFSTLPREGAGYAAPRVRPEGATSWIVRNASPLSVGDTRQDPFGANPMLDEAGARSYAGFPLIAGDEVYGVLYVIERSPQEYADGDVRLIEQMAGASATAIRRTQGDAGAPDPPA